MKLKLIASAFFAISLNANAAPDPNFKVTPEEQDWFRSLTQQGTGRLCCSISDCHYTTYKVSNGHYEVTIKGKSYPIPEETITHPKTNPTGQAVVCYTEYKSENIRIICFVPMDYS